MRTVHFVAQSFIVVLSMEQDVLLLLNATAMGEGGKNLTLVIYLYFFLKINFKLHFRIKLQGTLCAV